MVIQNTLRMREGKRVLLENNFRIATAVDLKKCLNHIKLPIVPLHMRTFI